MINPSTKELIKILLVEDDEVSAEAVRRALTKAQLQNRVIHAKDGVEALTALRGNGKRTVSPPYIVLLDLKLPRMGGHQFLEEVRNDPHLKQCVVFVLTTSESEDDLSAAYSKNVAGYVVKSRVGKNFTGLIDLLSAYSTTVRLPDKV